MKKKKKKNGQEDIHSFLTSIKLSTTWHDQLANNRDHIFKGPQAHAQQQSTKTWWLLWTLLVDFSSRPANMNTATIPLLLKPNKDPTLPSSYNHISLLNVDIKIYYNKSTQIKP